MRNKMPIFKTDDPIRDFENHDAWQERELKKRPVCEKCKEPITDDYMYEIDDLKLCSDCFTEYCDKHFKVSID